MSDGALPQELQDLLDRDQVKALVDRYLGSLDDGVTIDEAWARSLFTEDVHIDHRGFAIDGLEAIAFGHQVVSDGWERTLHFTSNERIEIAGDRAHLTARLFAIHLHRGPDAPEPYRIANVFTAEARRASDGWRFQTMNQETVWSSGQSHFDLERSDG